MKCPSCGGEIQNGTCTECGYQDPGAAENSESTGHVCLEPGAKKMVKVLLTAEDLANIMFAMNNAGRIEQEPEFQETTGKIEVALKEVK